jgi:hypothetical protein
MNHSTPPFFLAWRCVRARQAPEVKVRFSPVTALAETIIDATSVRADVSAEGGKEGLISAGRLQPDDADPAYDDYVFWMHHKKGSAIQPVMLSLNAVRIGEGAAWTRRCARESIRWKRDTPPGLGISTEKKLGLTLLTNQ